MRRGAAAPAGTPPLRKIYWPLLALPFRGGFLCICGLAFRGSPPPSSSYAQGTELFSVVLFQQWAKASMRRSALGLMMIGFAVKRLVAHPARARRATAARRRGAAAGRVEEAGVMRLHRLADLPSAMTVAGTAEQAVAGVTLDIE